MMEYIPLYIIMGIALGYIAFLLKTINMINMKRKVIKKGKTGICHFPKFLKSKGEYVQEIEISYSMMQNNDVCDSGLSKIWGVALGHLHWNNSYRFTFRIIKGKLSVWGYAYVGGQSPQENPRLKLSFGLVERVKQGDKLMMTINFDTPDLVVMTLDVYAMERIYRVIRFFPAPRGWRWPITECGPNIKCPHYFDMIFNFINP